MQASLGPSNRRQELINRTDVQKGRQHDSMKDCSPDPPHMSARQADP